MSDDALQLIRERAKSCPFASILSNQLDAGHPERESLISMFVTLSIVAEQQQELIRKLSAPRVAVGAV